MDLPSGRANTPHQRGFDGVEASVGVVHPLVRVAQDVRQSETGRVCGLSGCHVVMSCSVVRGYVKRVNGKERGYVKRMDWD